MDRCSRKVLLVNPPYSKVTYENVDRKAGTLQQPLLSLACVAAPLLKDGHEVRIADLDLEVEPYSYLERVLKDYGPDYVGVTGTTPMATEMAHTAACVKQHCPRAVAIAGGVHATTFPREILETTAFDIAVVGEGDFTLRDILRQDHLEDVRGIVFKRGDQLVATEPRPLLDNLDDLPFPAWELYDIHRYKPSRLLVRKRPSGVFETSRGCVFQCVYCNKNIFHRRFRHKSASRVADEMQHMARMGFRELHVEDDGFSTNLANAKAVCDEIVRRGVRIPWATANGIRVDNTDEELLYKLKQAGCYQVAFGIESGNQGILNRIRKGITKDQVRQAVRLARKVGLDSYGFFMLGLPGETEETMKETIEFAVELDLDIAKFAITIPLPGTPLFDEYDREGRILTRDWSKYLFHDLRDPVYRHENLEWKTIAQYYKKAHRAFYLRPRFIARRLRKGLTSGRLLYDVAYFLRTKWR